MVTSVGVQRRIRALQCAGWSQPAIARIAEVTPEAVSYWLNHGCTKRSTMRWVAHVYDMCVLMDPPNQVRESALAAGFVDGWRWLDIDDPDSVLMGVDAYGEAYSSAT